MKKKALSLFLVLVLMLTLVPVNAIADGDVEAPAATGFVTVEGNENPAAVPAQEPAQETTGETAEQPLLAAAPALEGAPEVEGTPQDVTNSDFVTKWNAVAADSELKLTENVTVSADLKEVPAGVTITLDTNGYTLDLNGHAITCATGASVHSDSNSPKITDSTGKYVNGGYAILGTQYSSVILRKNLGYTPAGGECITTVEGVTDQDHTGSDIVFDPLTVKYNGTPLTESTDGGTTGDYTVTYDNNKHVSLLKKATVTIKGVNDYAGEVIATFSIGLNKTEKIITATVVAVGAAVTIGIAAKTVKDYIDSKNTEKTDDTTTTDPAAKTDKGTTSGTTTSSKTVTKVTVDGTALDSKYYTVSGENVTISPDYLKTLADGKHTVKVYSGDSVLSSVDITIKDSTVVESAKTGDAGIVLYVGLALMAVLGCGVVLASKRRRAR